MLKIDSMNHGGIMANYRCTAACRHCLYASSPKREGGYISRQTAKHIASLLDRHGCHSVHIGGGEPFMSFDGLVDLIEELAKRRVRVEYVETNAYWAKDDEKAVRYINELLSAGVDTLCISIDPFHAEYVAPELPLRLSELCSRNGMGSFLWQQQFARLLMPLDMTKRHSRSELEAALSPDYIKRVAEHYGITYGGRAINIEQEYEQKQPLSKVLSSAPCKRLLATNHYHLDMHAKFVPPGCTGIAIPLEELLDGVPTGVYRVVDTLMSDGVEGLYHLAVSKGVEVEKEYTSGCALCIDLRAKLSALGEFPELYAEHYTASAEYYSQTT